MKISEKHRLWEKTDDELGGAIVLLEDAGSALKTAALLMFEVQAAHPDTIRLATDAIGMAQDAISLAAVCTSVRKSGVVEQTSDGFVWRPLTPDDTP